MLENIPEGTLLSLPTGVALPSTSCKLRKGFCDLVFAGIFWIAAVWLLSSKQMTES